MSKPRILSDLLPALTKDILGRKGMLFGKLLAEWPHIAGSDFADKCRPLELKFAKKTDQKSQAVLHLAVDSAFALEISYQKSLLMERLNVFFGYSAIKDIKIIQQTKVTDNRPVRRSPTRPLTTEENDFIEKIISDIKESDLQIALKNLGKAIVPRKSIEGK